MDLLNTICKSTDIYISQHNSRLILSIIIWVGRYISVWERTVYFLTIFTRRYNDTWDIIMGCKPNLWHFCIFFLYCIEGSYIVTVISSVFCHSIYQHYIIIKSTRAIFNYVHCYLKVISRDFEKVTEVFHLPSSR